VRASNSVGLGACAVALSTAGCVAGPKISDRPTSYLAMRYEATVPQKQEFTCGAASIATLLTYYWRTPTSEQTVLNTLKGRYTKDQIRHISETGLSFDDLIYMAQALGFSAEGAKVAINQLPNLAGPVIVHLNKAAFQHFVVLRKVGDGVYYLSDPVVGQLTMHADEFAAQYTGNALAVWKSSAGLPVNAKLTNPRDGIRVGDSLTREINVPYPPYSPGF
jgi:hypothetical protein